MKKMLVKDIIINCRSLQQKPIIIMPNRNKNCIHRFVCQIRKDHMYRLGRLWRTRSQLIIKSKITTITCMGIILGKMIMKMKKNIRWWGVVNHKKKGISLVIIIRIILGTTLEIIINIAIRYLRYVSKKRYHNSHSLMWKRRK